MHKCLYDCMIRGIHMRIQWEVTVAATVKRTVAIRRYDPVLPLQILEAHV